MMKINTLPAPTWRWLRMNAGETDITPTSSPALHIQEQQGAWSVSARDFRAIPGSAGAEFADLAEKLQPEALSLAASGEALLRTELSIKEGSASLDRLHIEALPDSQVTVIQRVTAQDSDSGTAALELLVSAAKKAQVTLVQIFQARAASAVLSSIGGYCAEGASIRLIQLVLDGEEIDLGAQILLQGDESRFSADIGYRACGSHRIDMNYVVPHEGKKSTCEIRAAGVLEDQAQKIFRGTIDFRKGSAGAVGAETEDVLLMNDGPVNQTIPLILCAEEDVSGTHGATIGRLSDELVYYMESRGLPYEAIYRQMALSRLNAVAHLIPDDVTRSELLETLNGEETEAHAE